MKNTHITFPALIACAGLLSACSVTPQLSDAPSDPPPQWVAGGEFDASGRVVYQWDRPAAFGKVLGERKVLGDAACLMGRPDLEALGYHPMAKDSDGLPIPGGGYLCGVKARGDKPATQAPRLIRTNGVLGWDMPSAFGAVPAEHKARGDAVCAKAQPGFEAVAYHPDARDEGGKPIVDSGFFCAPKRKGARAVG